ncbi:type VII secretion integral membrane protein EccD [Mycolicibacterium sp. CBMA 226]|uniref:type VII secretion integral membrane protein EccD n=1 Tax=Mycolicibacterium sp. CBMA 226 TaxID=2606611 RepID=UPI0012DBD258|nr:type VII secretion integral membrane protein EccD [Mycolicibacterium sp. CBMA 226]MUL77289.1 type VII secretion integral membrane protein EccD [Mycolicibacterium sp. CBMA 226]
MSEAVCRLSVRTDGEHIGEITDLVLPAGAAVDALLPDIVALVHPHPPEGVSWRLGRATGGPIDGSLSLRQNGVHDGDVLHLQRDTVPELGTLRVHTAAMAADAAPPDARGHLVAPALRLWAVTVAAVMLLSSAVRGDQPVAAAISCGGMLAALTASWRSGRAEWPAAAVILAFAAGFAAVPGGPAAPNALLGSAAAFAVALVLLRVGAYRVSVTAAAFSAPMIVATTVASSWSLPLTSSGVIIAAVALAVLSAAPRCAVTVAGLTPHSATVADGDARRIDAAHRVLTAMVMGAAAAAAAGAVVVAIAAVQQSGVPTLVFSWVVAAAMALRAPSYQAPVRRWAVLTAGMVCITAALAVTAMVFPAGMDWLGAGVIATVLGIRRIGPVSAPVVQRLVYLEYAALVAVPPCALWATDVFRLVRGG